MIVRALLKPAAIGAFRIFDRLRSNRHRYIFILSHMRSGSSLLLHLLMTNPEISGYGERNRAYQRASDLDVFAIRSNLAVRGRRRASMSVDQLNHTHFLPDESLLAHPRVLPIILMRDPEHAIGSMMQTFNRFRTFRLEEGVEHYRERVATLSRYAKKMAGIRAFFALTYDQLVSETDVTLARLQDFLGLEQPFCDNYETYEFTGTRGDPSDRIRAGKVLPPRRDHDANIDAATLAELRGIYRDCRATCGLGD